MYNILVLNEIKLNIFLDLNIHRAGARIHEIDERTHTDGPNVIGSPVTSPKEDVSRSSS